MFVPLPEIMIGRHWRTSGELQEKWCSLIKRLVDANPSFFKTVNTPARFWHLFWAYSERHRHYHTPAHLLDCLREYEKAIPHTMKSLEVETALWFHDAVYDPHSRDNEEKSAELAANYLANFNMPGSFTEKVRKLVLATKHTSPPENPEEALIQDIDLAILGKDRKAFDIYEMGLREEYKWMEMEQCIARRIKVLNHFLERPGIYTTDYFHSLYEENARANLENSLARVQNLGRLMIEIKQN